MGKMNKKFTYEEVNQFVTDNSGCILLSTEYINNSTKMKFKCECDNTFQTTFNAFKLGKRCCNACAKKRAILKTRFSFQYVEDFVISNSECALVSTDYTNDRSKLKFRCKCGNVFETTFDTFRHKNKRTCDVCSEQIRIEKRKKTNNEFLNEVNKLTGKEYLFLESYTNAYTKILVKHNKCGHIYKVSPGNFLSGSKCPNCAGNIKGTTEQFKKKLEILYGDEYLVLGSYINANTKIEMKHNKCGYEWSVVPFTILKGHGCPICAIDSIKSKQRKSNKQFLKEVYKLVKEEYTFLEKYINSTTKIKVRHNKCGETYYVKPVNFLSGSRCPSCMLKENAKNLRKSNEEFLKEIDNSTVEEYTFLGEYVDSKTKIKVLHNKCGHVWEVFPSNFKKGSRCPQCKESRGERIVRDYLRKNHIKFRSQYKIKGCRNTTSLPFDFALFNKNKLIALVEFDGIQHTKIVKHFGGTDGFERRQRNDAIKNNYCTTKGIPLIRISYTVENIEEYLENELKKLNKKYN